MSKIKDNIDLKELQRTYIYKCNKKEFKFKYDEYWNEYYITIENEKIGINANTKNIYLEYLGSSFLGNIIELDVLNIFFDLIRAGFLEEE